jgi:hypothetical protein
MQPYGSLPCLQQLAAGFYSELDDVSLQPCNKTWFNDQYCANSFSPIMHFSRLSNNIASVL